MQAFTLKTVDAAPLGERLTESAVRHAFYRMQLATGEVDLADGKFAESAAAFAAAAGIYEGHAMDATDIVLLLQAKFNEANSLLRLSKWDEALRIYALVEHGFERFATPSALQRVKQAAPESHTIRAHRSRARCGRRRQSGARGPGDRGRRVLPGAARTHVGCGSCADDRGTSGLI